MVETLEQVAAMVRSCQRCALCAGRTQGVPGEGAGDAPVVFVGEAPGFHEDRQGRPFVGPSGQYLEQLLTSVGLARRNVYITNVVKCRPPGNRDPQPDEIIACRDYLENQLALIKPVVVVTLGRYSMDRYFPGQSITRIHGLAKRVGDVSYLPLFHPAAALRNPEWRKAMEQDFRHIPELLAQAARNKQPPGPSDSSDGTADRFEQLTLF